MQLLPATQAKTEKDAKAEAQKERIRKLNDEETAAAKRLNATLSKEKEEEDRVKKSQAERNASSAVKKTVLEAEVEALESRKRDLMRPVDELRREAETKLAELEKSTQIVSDREMTVKQKESVLIERTEAQLDREQELKDKESKLDLRENGISAAEAEIKRSTDVLAGKWVDYHKAINEVNVKEDAVARREKEVEDARHANDSIRQANEDENKRLRQEDRRLRDGYVALEQAKIHLGLKP